MSIDLLFIGKAYQTKIKEKINTLYKISKNNIIITATHTHSAPKTCENFFDGITVNQDFFNNVIEKSCKAVKIAFKVKNEVSAELFQTLDYPAINRRLPVPLVLKIFPNYFKNIV